MAARAPKRQRHVLFGGGGAGGAGGGGSSASPLVSVAAFRQSGEQDFGAPATEQEGGEGAASAAAEAEAADLDGQPFDDDDLLARWLAAAPEEDAGQQAAEHGQHEGVSFDDDDDAAVDEDGERPQPSDPSRATLASARALLQQQAGQPLQSLSLPGGGGGGEVPSPQQQQQHQEGEGGLPRGAADEPGPSAAAGEPHAAASGGGAAAGGTLVSASDLDPSEAVLRVQVCKPKGGVRASQEFLVLGSQRLTELRDRLVCTTDSVARVYLPDHPAPGGFFFIEGTFYNDMRDPNAADLSEPLRAFPHQLAVTGHAPEQQLQLTAAGDGEAQGDIPLGLEGGSGGAQEPARSSHRFSAASMEATTFEDLSLRLRAPYCYCHQGTCEHFVVFTELRRLRPDDRQTRAEYPVQLYWDRPRLKVCGICLVNAAQKTVLRSRLAPTSPCFFCGECFQRLHYDAQGRLLFSDFEVYEHIENTL